MINKLQYVRPGKKKSPQVHHKPKITYDIDWRDVDLQTGGVYTHKPLKVRKLGGKHHTSRGLFIDWLVLIDLWQVKR